MHSGACNYCPFVLYLFDCVFISLSRLGNSRWLDVCHIDLVSLAQVECLTHGECPGNGDTMNHQSFVAVLSGHLTGLTFLSIINSLVKNLPANAGDIRDAGLILGSGRSPGEGNGNPLHYSCLGNPMDKGAWWATSMRLQRIRHD